jgi:hypothetical protein
MKMPLFSLIVLLQFSMQMMGQSLPSQVFLPTAYDPNTSIQAQAGIVQNNQTIINTWANNSMLQITNAYVSIYVPKCYLALIPLRSDCLMAMAAVTAVIELADVANDSANVANTSSVTYNAVTSPSATNGTTTVFGLNAVGTQAMTAITSLNVVISLSANGNTFQTPDKKTYDAEALLIGNYSTAGFSTTDQVTFASDLATINQSLTAPPLPSGAVNPQAGVFTGTAANGPAGAAVATGTTSGSTTAATSAAPSATGAASMQSFKILIDNGKDAIGVSTGNLFNSLKSQFTSIGKAGGFLP